MQVQPYVFFDGRCEEAINFYRTALGAEVQMMMRNRESRTRTRRGRCRPARTIRSCTPASASERRS
jgi:PhnB protein